MPIVGLNLGKNSFKAVELERRRDKIVLNNFGSYENPHIDLTSDSKEDVEAVSKSLAEFFSDTGFSTSNVVVGLDEKHVFMRIISLPAMNDKELRNSIKYEAEQYIPLPLDQVSLSYQRLSPDFSRKSQVDVQLVAAKKDILEKYVKILKGAKLYPKAIEPETIALGRILGDTIASPVSTMVLDMGLSSTLIVISYGGFVRFTRAVSIGGDTLTRALEQNLSLDISQAEEYKKTYGLQDLQTDGKVGQVLKPLVDNLVLEVKRAMVFFTKHNPSANIKRVILTGGTALMPNLLQYLASNLDVEVQLSNPLVSMEISPKLGNRARELESASPMYSSAVGLALREFVK